MSNAITLVQVLAMIMFGEAGILQDKQASLAVGHVYLNRLNAGSYGSSLVEVASSGFRAFDVVELGDVPEEYFDLARTLIDNTSMRADFTGGCLYIISYQDVAAVYGIHAAGVYALADWISATREVNGVTYGLFAYVQLPDMEDLCLWRLAASMAAKVGLSECFVYSKLVAMRDEECLDGRL